MKLVLILVLDLMVNWYHAESLIACSNGDHYVDWHLDWSRSSKVVKADSVEGKMFISFNKIIAFYFVQKQDIDIIWLWVQGRCSVLQDGEQSEILDNCK